MAGTSTPDDVGKPDNPIGVIPPEFLKVIAIWSLIPAYLVAGAFLGWLADRWLGSYPAGIGIGLIVALILSVHDMYRLRDEL